MAKEQLMEYEKALELFEVVIGLEVHIELNTKSKMFCGCANAFGDAPNTNVCPICLALPGALPAVNKKAIESSIAIGLALDCQIAPTGRFSRKNYFYPDLAKNFQTSQYDEPIAFEGKVSIELEDGEVFEIDIERAHMEEDAGKLTHVGGATGRIQGAEYSLVDYNRAGVPLVEIVTKPVYGTGARAPEVASTYVRYIRDMVKAMNVSDARMERGNVRCDANVSIRPKGQQKLGTRTETKNVNSLRSIENAVKYEIQRQAFILSNGGSIIQETRHWHEDRGHTSSGRPKSDADDYRYFPEPDLVPVQPSLEWIEEIRKTLPENPALRRKRLQQDWGFADLEFRDVLNSDLLDQIEATVAAGASAQSARKWWTGELARLANANNSAVQDLAITPEQVAKIQALIDSGKLTDRMARDVVAGVLAGEGEPEAVVEKRGLKVVSDEGALIAAIDEALAKQPEVLEKIREGKVQAAGAVIGAVMQTMRGQVDAARVRELILERAK
ncbi:Asp-tRNA(Asn)/Glu-tRNA(Gln) amidotransferase subunit GatB [Candidatus Aquiluna sp. UB-MaderosW2red]|uniref:Asp-tRNA(Asn)/Glu-tRNA(Gln) amidotransferase subunit GatB n=1 Tax=Candidatus Aquiluna sp. UB-MaderosW2red TaxID=1855377 RepID=UPI000875DB54|nr:Asp-tRNA(Asn)/Glu-tRNA(Gln) amidotransferase subunit GatB [Candidatus Aquiluna sp. UB-MaderosW2red]SCX09752.1 aspartyl-tRNA(Asn)/glutamyl-tRNA(Gln) amidotransferase subunit B [Candidatus Aquiluna sp. UB-MaderosW2red]